MTFRAGDPITCTGGHPHGQFLRDGRAGVPIIGEDFSITSGKPDGSGYSCDLPGCGEPLAMQLEEGHWCVHTPQGWRV